MIGLILTGHGKFASGLDTSLDLIMGKREAFEIVDFDGNGTEKYENDLKNAMERLSDCTGILVMSDLMGGSPFKISAMLSATTNTVRVVSGTNLPMACEVAMSRSFLDDVDALTAIALEAGKNGVNKFELMVQEDELSDDGI